MTGVGQILSLEDCPQDPIQGLTLAVVGFGNQGTAQALNLRDSGFRVLVGADPGRPSSTRAAAAGFEVLALEGVLAAADLVVMTAPDELHRAVVGRLLGADPERSSSPPAPAPRPPRAPEHTWVFAHGFSLVHDPPPFPAGDDVVVVAPAGPGVQVRERYVQGSGIPALCAVHRDGSGQAEARARAYAAAMGAARAGLIRSTVRDEVEIDLFGEQAVLCGGMNALTAAAFDTLVAAGYDPQAAYLECVHQLRLTAELVESYGIEGMRRRISTTALYGDLTRGPRLAGPELRKVLTEILAEVRSGRFAEEWLARRRQEPDWPDSAPSAARHPGLEAAGEVVRGLFPSGRGPENPS